MSDEVSQEGKGWNLLMVLEIAFNLLWSLPRHGSSSLLYLNELADGTEVIEATKRIASMMQKDIIGVSLNWDIRSTARLTDSAYLSSSQLKYWDI
jgi:hypothetical protein